MPVWSSLDIDLTAVLNVIMCNVFGNLYCNNLYSGKVISIVLLVFITCQYLCS